VIQHTLCTLVAVWNIAGLGLVDHGMVTEFFPAMAMLAS